MVNQIVARLINFGSFDAATNMAIDEAILEAHLQGSAPPTLRLYQFAPQAVSIGYAQRVDVKTIENIKSQGIDIVRRPTGGRAVLHLGDLTYSFIGSSVRRAVGLPMEPKLAQNTALLMEGSVIGAYHQISAGLLDGIAQLEVKLEMGLDKSINRLKEDCFAATTVADLHYQGKKLIGSAQMRRKHAVLQHGSIILNQPQALMARLLGSDSQVNVLSPDDPLKSARHANLFEIIGRQVAPIELQLALKTGFERVFSMNFIVGDLLAQEITLYQQLRPKYAKSTI